MTVAARRTPFVKLVITTRLADGTVTVPDHDVWVNLDHVTTIEPLLESNVFARHQAGNDELDAEYYPLVELTTTDGRHHVVPLGSYADEEEAKSVLDQYLPTLTHRVDDDVVTSNDLAMLFDQPHSNQ